MKKLLLLLVLVVVVPIVQAIPFQMVANDTFNRADAGTLGNWEYFAIVGVQPWGNDVGTGTRGILNNEGFWGDGFAQTDDNIATAYGNSSVVMGVQVTCNQTNGKFIVGLGDGSDNEACAVGWIGGNLTVNSLGAGENLSYTMEPNEKYSIIMHAEFNSSRYSGINDSVRSIKVSGPQESSYTEYNNSGNGWECLDNIDHNFDRISVLTNQSMYCALDNIVVFNGTFDDYSFVEWLDLSFSFYDERNNTLIEDETWTITIRNTTSSTELTTTNNPFYLEQASGTYDVLIESDNFPRRDYLDYYINKSNLNYFYLLADSDGDTKTLTVKDSDGDAISDVSVVYKRFIGTSWQTVAQEETDVAGQSVLDLDSSYEYQINFTHTDYQNKVIYLEPSAATYTIYLDDLVAAIPPLAESYLLRRIGYNLTYINDTREVIFNWSDPNDYADELCLSVYDFNTSQFYNCSSAETATLRYTITTLNRTYTAKAIGKVNNNPYVIETIDINLQAIWQELGRDMLLVVMLVFLTMSLIAIANPIAGILLGTVSLAAMYMFGVLPIGLGTLLGIVFVAIIIIVGMVRKG